MRFLKLDKHTDSRKATRSSEQPTPLEPSQKVVSKVTKDALPSRPSTVPMPLRLRTRHRDHRHERKVPGMTNQVFCFPFVMLISHIGHMQSADSPIVCATAELEASMSKLQEHCKTLVQDNKAITLITIDDATFQRAIHDAKKRDIRASAENSAAVIASFLRQIKANEESTQS